MYYLSGWAEGLRLYRKDTWVVIHRLIKNFHMVYVLYGRPLHARVGCNGCLTVIAIAIEQKQYDARCYFSCGTNRHVLSLWRH